MNKHANYHLTISLLTHICALSFA